MIIRDGRAFWTTAPGEDLSYWLRGYAVTGYGTPRETLIHAKDTFQDIHRIFDGDIVVLEKLAESCILGEAYHNAALVYNGNGRTDAIPNAKTYFRELRKLIKRYEYNGFKFEKCDADLIAAIFNEG